MRTLSKLGVGPADVLYWVDDLWVLITQLGANLIERGEDVFVIWEPLTLKCRHSVGIVLDGKHHAVGVMERGHGTI